MTTTETFYAENIRCSGCINTIQAALYKIPGVQAVQVSLTEKKDIDTGYCCEKRSYY